METRSVPINIIVVTFPMFEVRMHFLWQIITNGWKTITHWQCTPEKFYFLQVEIKGKLKWNQIYRLQTNVRPCPNFKWVINSFSFHIHVAFDVAKLLNRGLMNLSDNLCKLSISERLFILIIGFQNDIKIKCKWGNYYSIMVGHKGLINCIVKQCIIQYQPIINIITPPSTISIV